MQERKCSISAPVVASVKQDLWLVNGVFVYIAAFNCEIYSILWKISILYVKIWNNVFTGTKMFYIVESVSSQVKWVSAFGLSNNNKWQWWV